MARDFQINGETLVRVQTGVLPGFNLQSATELGLAIDAIQVSFTYNRDILTVDAWGKAPVDVQNMNMIAHIRMNLVHVDIDVLEAVQQITVGGNATLGTVGRAGVRLGNNVAPGVGAGRLITVGLTSPQLTRPYRFYNCYLDNPPIQIPLGTERSVFALNWTAIPYVDDPYQASAGCSNWALYDRTSMGV